MSRRSAAGEVDHGTVDSDHPGRRGQARWVRAREADTGMVAPPVIGRRSHHGEDVRRRRTAAINGVSKNYGNRGESTDLEWAKEGGSHHEANGQGG